jgi:hypothetical protein
MWSHYADSHKGICVGLDVSVLRRGAISLRSTNEVLECLPVIYSAEMPQINFFEAMLDHNDSEHVMTFVRVKSEHWRYEDEYRLIIHDRIDTAKQFSPALINQVIFGCRMPETELHNLAKFCRINIPHARLLRAVKDNRFFRLNVVPFG